LRSLQTRGNASSIAKAKELLDSVSLQLSDNVFFDVIPDQALVNLMDFVEALIECVNEDMIDDQSQQSDTYRSVQLGATIRNCIMGMCIMRMFGMVNNPCHISSFSLLDKTQFRQLAANVLKSPPENLLPIAAKSSWKIFKSLRSAAYVHQVVLDKCLVDFRGPESNAVTFSQFLHVSHDVAMEKMRQVKLALNRERIRLMMIGRYDKGCGLSELPVDVLELIKNHLVDCWLPRAE